jgi:hypothetical protein
MSTKKQPYSIGKQQFYEMLKPLSKNIIAPRINEIIFDRRKDFNKNKNLTKHQIINTRSIEREEYLEYFKVYGYPDGFENE